jgi:hypothetical protein
MFLGILHQSSKFTCTLIVQRKGCKIMRVDVPSPEELVQLQTFAIFRTGRNVERDPGGPCVAPVAQHLPLLLPAAQRNEFDDAEALPRRRLSLLSRRSVKAQATAAFPKPGIPKRSGDDQQHVQTDPEPGVPPAATNDATEQTTADKPVLSHTGSL